MTEWFHKIHIAVPYRCDDCTSSVSNAPRRWHTAAFHVQLSRGGSAHGAWSCSITRSPERAGIRGFTPRLRSSFNLDTHLHAKVYYMQTGELIPRHLEQSNQNKSSVFSGFFKIYYVSAHSPGGPFSVSLPFLMWGAQPTRNCSSDCAFPYYESHYGLNA